jgi:hypothetical protein
VSDHGDFEQLRQFITGMLANSEYEKMLLITANALFSDDAYKQGKFYYKKLAKGYQSISENNTHNCQTCKKPLSSIDAENEKTLLFRCGHGYHENCASRSLTCTFCDTQSDIQSKTKRTRNYKRNQKHKDQTLNNSYQSKMDKWDKVASKLRETEQNHNLILSRIDGNKSVDSVIALNLAPPIPLEDENAPDVKDEYQQAVSGILEKSLFDFVADDFY